MSIQDDWRAAEARHLIERNGWAPAYEDAFRIEFAKLGASPYSKARICLFYDGTFFMLLATSDGMVVMETVIDSPDMAVDAAQRAVWALD